MMAFCATWELAQERSSNCMGRAVVMTFVPLQSNGLRRDIYGSILIACHSLRCHYGMYWSTFLNSGDCCAMSSDGYSYPYRSLSTPSMRCGQSIFDRTNIAGTGLATVWCR